MEDLKNSKLRYIKDFFAYAEESFIYMQNLQPERKVVKI